MIDVKERLLDSLIYKARQLAEHRRENQLLSVTKKIAPIHLLSFFDECGRLNKDRLFWADVEDDFYMIGVGHLTKLKATDNHSDLSAKDNRYDLLKEKWQSFTEKALIHNEDNYMGTGLIALGGMSFDPLNKRTAQWDKFPTSELLIPEIVLVKHKHHYYATLNTYINKDEDVYKRAREIEQKEARLFNYHLNMMNKGHQIVNKKEINSEQWIDSVIRARDEVRADRMQKIVMAREMKVTLNEEANLAVIINNLINSQPNSYVFAFEKDEDCFIGATPERLVRVTDDRVLSTCLAGTAPRGKTRVEDDVIKKQLFFDHKNREEHDYVVQMIRKSINPYCNNLTIPNQPVVLSLKDLHHLYTPVTAQLKKHATIFDFIEELHPTPALGGEPKEQSLAFIREHEKLDRGWYGAPVGWLDHNLNGEFAVAIRSGLIQKNVVSLFAGCGVMKDSDPQLEYEETNVKFLPMLNALEGHNGSYE